MVSGRFCEEENRRGRPNGPWKSEEAKPSIEPFITVDASSWHGKVRPTREVARSAQPISPRIRD